MTVETPDLPGSSTSGPTGPAALERYVHEHIPLTRHMEVSVRRADGDRVVLEAPLEPNINHRDTVFGGSASALAILAGWAMVHVRLQSHAVSARRIVIQRNRIEYLEPIEAPFRAVCEAPTDEAWVRFLRTLRRRRVGRVELTVTLETGETTAGRLEGAYVALDGAGS